MTTLMLTLSLFKLIFYVKSKQEPHIEYFLHAKPSKMKILSIAKFLISLNSIFVIKFILVRSRVTKL